MPVDESWLLLTKTYAAVGTAAIAAIAVVLACLALKVRRLARRMASEKRSLAEQIRGLAATARTSGRETAGSVGRLSRLIGLGIRRLTGRAGAP